MHRVRLVLGILVGLTFGTSPQAEGKFRHDHDYRRVHHSYVFGNYTQPSIIILNSWPDYYVHSSLDYYNDRYMPNNAVPRYNSLDYYNNIYKPYYAVPHY
jgi:hypothetical protein